MIIEKYAVRTNNDPTVWPLQHCRVSMSVNKRFHFKKETDPQTLKYRNVCACVFNFRDR